MRGWTRAVLTAVATAAFTLTGGTAGAAELAEGWTANPGTTVDENGVVTLDSANGPTSLEHQNLQVMVVDGDTIAFEYQGTCAAGAPRLFIQGGAFNTWDQDPNGVTSEPACGDDTDGDGWIEVVATIENLTAEDADGNEIPEAAGYTGLVNDGGDPRVIDVRNIIIAGEQIEVVEPEDDGAGEEPGPKKQNHGQCVSSADEGGEARSEAAKSDCGKPAQAQGKSDRS